MADQDQVEARFEFRVFGNNEELAAIRQRLADRTVVAQSQRSDIYLLAIEEALHNVKLRDGDLLDIKRLVRIQDDLEQWRPIAKVEFPLFPEMLRAELYPAWELVAPLLPRESYSVREMIEELVLPSSQLVALVVDKNSREYTIDGCSAEYTELTINGATLDTFAIEHEDPHCVAQARAKMGVSDAENVSYPLALKRLCGFKLSPYLRDRLH